MLTNISESYLYLVDFFSKRIGFTKITDEMLNKAVAILADYYVKIESNPLAEEEINNYRLSTIDALLDMTGNPGLFSRRTAAAWELFPQYERDDEVKNFESWLRRRTGKEDQKYLQKMNETLTQDIDRIITDAYVVEFCLELKYSDQIPTVLLKLDHLLNHLDQFLN